MPKQQQQDTNQLVYLDISIGDQEKYLKDLASYNLFKEFYKQQGHLVGLTTTTTLVDSSDKNKQKKRAQEEEKDDDDDIVIKQLTLEQKELLVESFESMNEWKQKGDILTEKPNNIRIGRIEIELFHDKCPKTSKNFLSLCTGSQGMMSKMDKKKQLHYKNIGFHRLVKSYIVQGGDILRGDGSGGDSLYGGKFNDEKEGLKMKFEEYGKKGYGCLGMANSGKNSNTSQFFFTLISGGSDSNDNSVLFSKLNGKNVLFGQVKNEEGYHVLERMNQVETTKNEKTLERIFINDCGVV